MYCGASRSPALWQGSTPALRRSDIRPACRGFRGHVLNIVGKIDAIETIAEGNGIRELGKLREQFGQGNWKKKKGIATLRIEGGATARAEIHWYEAHGIGKVKMKVKRWI